MTLPTSMAQLGRRQGSHLFRYYQGKINQRQFPQLYSAFHRGIDTCTDPLESSKDVVGHSHIHISSRNFSTANGKATTPTEETKEKKEPLSIPVTHEIDSDDDEPKNSGDANDDIDIDRSKFTHEIKIRMPDMGAGEGKVVHWFKKEGDIIKTGDTLCDIETPDFTFGMTIDDECKGIMGKILYPAGGDPVPDKRVICILLHEAEKV